VKEERWVERVVRKGAVKPVSMDVMVGFAVWRMSAGRSAELFPIETSEGH
jgi:hypothetical protein